MYMSCAHVLNCMSVPRVARMSGGCNTRATRSGSYEVHHQKVLGQACVQLEFSVLDEVMFLRNASGLSLHAPKSPLYASVV